MSIVKCSNWLCKFNSRDSKGMYSTCLRHTASDTETDDDSIFIELCKFQEKDESIAGISVIM